MPDPSKKPVPLDDAVVEAAAKAICNYEADPGEAWDDFLPESDVRVTSRAEAQAAILAADEARGEPASERARRGIALTVMDVLRGTEFDDPTLTADAKDALVEACRTMAVPERLTEAAEKRVLRLLLSAGWNLCPAPDQGASR